MRSSRCEGGNEMVKSAKAFSALTFFDYFFGSSVHIKKNAIWERNSMRNLTTVVFAAMIRFLPGAFLPSVKDIYYYL